MRTQRRADLNPPLGWMGGLCKVVERIEDTVRAPSLREDLSEKVERGQKLTNPEAAKVYTLETERGGGIFEKIRISHHAQYRMDQRGVTVGDLRVFFIDFSKRLNDWKSQKAWEWDYYSEAIARGEPVEWMDKRLGDLLVVFATSGRGVADIVTTYFKGEPDPRPGTCSTHPQHFHTARTVEDMSPVRTFVKTPAPSQSDTDKPQGTDGKYPTQGLPSPPWSRSKPTKGPTVLNSPGESGSDSDGTIHKDKVRTKGTPGGQYDNGKTHPTPDVTDSQITPHRRPSRASVEPDLFEGVDPALIAEIVRLAGMYPPAYPTGQTRHREQRGQAYRYFHKRYRRQRGKIINRQKRRHKRLKNNGRYTLDRERRKEFPERFTTRPSGGVRTISERSKKQREKAKKAFEPIPFYHYDTDQWGTLIEVSPLEVVHFELEGERGTTDLDTFFDEVVVDEDRLGGLLNYLDEVFEVFEYDQDDEDEDSDEDPRFDAWLGQSKTAYKRRRKQRGTARRKSRMEYMRNRMAIKRRSKARYRRMRNNPAFKRKQKLRREHPERFKMRTALTLTTPDIAFVFITDEGLVSGMVRNVSDMSKRVSYWLNTPGHQLLQTMIVDDFLLKAVFLSEEDTDKMFDLVDTEIGLEAYDLDEDEEEMVAEEAAEETLEKLAADVVSDFLREQRPPDMVDDTRYDRANDHDERKRRDRTPGTPGIYGPYEKEIMDSNPGSRVLPSGAGHVEKAALFNYRGLEPKCRQALFALIKSPLWKQYMNGRAGDKDVIRFLHAQGWDGLSQPGLHRLFDHMVHMKFGGRTAARIEEIRQGCSPDLLSKGEKLSVKLRRVDTRNAMWLFDVEGSKEPYRIRFQAMRKGNVKALARSHVRVSCSCPFWRWQGPEHWAKQGDYLYGKPVGSATKPTIKDPSGQHRACKHVLAIFMWFDARNVTVPEASIRRVAFRYLGFG